MASKKQPTAKSWTTEDESVMFSLENAKGELSLLVIDTQNDESVELATDISQLDECIDILKNARVAAQRLLRGDSIKDLESEEEEEGEEEESEEEELEEEEDDEEDEK